MDPPHSSHHHHHHHHRLHLHLDPRHHHHIHIHLCHHSTRLFAAAPPAHHHNHQAAPHSFPNSHLYPTATPWQLEEPPTHAAALAGLQQGEAVNYWEEPALQAEQEEGVYLEEEEEEEEGEPVFVLTDEWAEFFAKADAKRRLAKQQQKKNMSRKK